MRRALLAPLLALALLSPLGSAAQAVVELRGRVVEAGAGGPVAGAVVRVSGPREASTLTGRDGRWVVRGLPAGEYRVRVDHIGFAARTVETRVPAAVAGEQAIALTAVALPLDAVVVTASRRVQRLAEAPVATELITRREIEQARVADLSTLLTERLGIQPQGGHPAGQGVMLQGLGAERVLVLVDGQPLVGRLGGEMDLSRIPTAAVERVEVVKGPQSSLYGSEAMGGVVNVITRAASPRPWDLGVDVTAGSQARVDATTSLSGTRRGVDFLADVGRRSTNLTPGRAAEQGALARRWDGLLKAGWAAGPALRVEASALLLDERQRWQAGQLFHFADNRQWSARAGAQWARGAHRLSPTLYVSEFDHLSRRATAPTPVAGTGEREVQRLWEADLLYNLGWGAHALDAGVEAKREEIISDRVAGEERVHHTLEPFAQLTWAAGDWRLVPGARLSASEQWGAHFTPRLAVMYRPVAPLALRASVGRGFRAPAFKERYMEFLNVGPGFGYTVRGNPHLRPETSTNLSLGAELAAGRVYLRGQLFHNRFRDFIETRLEGDSVGLQVYTYGNTAEGFTQGIELEGGAAWRGLRAEAGYGYLRAEDASTGSPLLGRPAHSARASLDAPLPLGFRGALTGLYTGETPVLREEATPGGEAVALQRGSFLRFDLRLARDLPQDLVLTLGARNLFDARPREWPGFVGRHLYVGLGWRAAGAARPAETPNPL